MQIECKEILEKDIWDSLVTKFHGRFIQSWGMGEAYSASGEGVKRLAFYEGETLIGVASLIVVNARRGRFGLVPYGPLLIKKDWKNILIK